MALGVSITTKLKQLEKGGTGISPRGSLTPRTILDRLDIEKQGAVSLIDKKIRDRYKKWVKLVYVKRIFSDGRKTDGSAIGVYSKKPNLFPYYGGKGATMKSYMTDRWGSKVGSRIADDDRTARNYASDVRKVLGKTVRKVNLDGRAGRQRGKLKNAFEWVSGVGTNTRSRKYFLTIPTNKNDRGGDSKYSSKTNLELIGYLEQRYGTIFVYTKEELEKLRIITAKGFRETVEDILLNN